MSIVLGPRAARGGLTTARGGRGRPAPACLLSLTSAAHPPVRTIGVRALPLTPGAPGLSEEDLAYPRPASGRGRRGAPAGIPRHRQQAAAGAHRLRAGRPVPRRARRANGAAPRGGARPLRPAAGGHGRGRPGWTSTRVRTVWPAVLAKLAKRADRGPPGRSGGRLRHPVRTRRRTGTPRGRVGWPRRSTPAPRPRSSGIRFKSLEPATRRRGLRTLDLVLAGCSTGRAAAGLGDHPAQGDLGGPGRGDGRHLRAGSSGVRAGRGALRFEIQVETPQAVLLADGTAASRRWCTRRPGAAPGCTSGPTTTPPGWGSPAATRASTTRRPTTPRR